jgi:hypothetical protein
VVKIRGQDSDSDSDSRFPDSRFVVRRDWYFTKT